MNPVRGAVPTLSPSNVQPSFVHFADDAIFAYAVSCACRQAPEAVLELATTLDTYFGQGAIGKAAFSRASSDANVPPPASFEDILIDTAMAFRRCIHATPRDYCLAGVRFLQQAQRSTFKSILVPIIATWQRNAWTRIVVSERFRLNQPRRTVPAIKVSLSLTLNNEKFLCSLILAAACATNVALPNNIRTAFENIATPGG